MDVHDRIAGADLLIEQFGDWPSFHDAEVLQIAFERPGDKPPRCKMTIHAWTVTSEVDDNGHYILTNHTLVNFLLEDLLSTELKEFNCQNALFALRFESIHINDRLAVQAILESSYGVSGFIVCRSVRVADVLPCDATGLPIAQ